MSRYMLEGNSYIVSHTFEKRGPHVTRGEFYRHESYYTITCVLRGKGKCFVEGRCYSVEPGDAILLCTDELRRFSFAQEEEMERITIYLLPSVTLPLASYGFTLQRVFQSELLGNGNKINLSMEGKDSVWRIIKDIKEQMKDWEETDRSLRNVEMHTLILRLLVCLCRINKSTMERICDNNPAILNVCEYIQKNLSEKLTYRHIQENCKVSRYQLGVVFPRYTGMTLTEYVVQKRLIRVAELVMKGGKIENAAIKSGFQNYSYFYKAFIKYRGVSPKEYFRFLR